MNRNYFIFFSLIVILFLLGCFGNNDTKSFFGIYGTFEEATVNSIKIRTDDDRLLTVSNPHVFKTLPPVNSRTLTYFTTDADTSLQSYSIDVEHSRFFSTLKILSDTTTLDSIGENPVAITSAWFGGGFLNVETLAGIDYVNIKRIKYNIVKNNSKVDTLHLTLFANDFIGKLVTGRYISPISISIDSLLTDPENEIIVSIGGNREAEIDQSPLRWAGTYARTTKYKNILLEQLKK